MLFTIVVFILTLLVLVVSHELGHFLVAKKFGVKVLEFGFGLPPKIFKKTIGDTPVSLNWLPIGGFVRLLGEDETEDKVLKDKASFSVKPVYQRIGIVVAGVVMNLVLAVVLFSVVLFAQGFKERIPLLIPFEFIGATQTNEVVILVGKVAPSSPAEKAGMKAGDQITLFNGAQLKDSQELIDLTKANLDQQVTLNILSQGEEMKTVELVPRSNPPEGEGALGIELGTITIANLYYQTFPQKLVSGVSHSYNLASYSLVILGNLISASFEAKNLEPVSHSLAGPVGITNIADTILKTNSPLLPYLSFVAILSLNLAIINILPFPALDGGRLVFLLIEGVFRKKVRAEVEKWIHTIGMAFLIALIVLVTFSDIRKILF